MVSVERVKSILLNPKATWAAIDKEPATPGSLYRGYVLPLAAIGPVASLVGWEVFGEAGYRLPIGFGLKYAVVSYLGALINVFVLALIIDALAPTFDGKKNPQQALKVAVYSSTAFWVGGIFAVIPGLGFLGLLGVYSLYLLYLGLPLLMQTPTSKSMSYTAVVVLSAVVLYIVVIAVVTQFTARPIS